MFLYSFACILGLMVAMCLPSLGYSAENTFVPGGALRSVDESGKVIGECPLEHTDVEADIVGFVSRVTVRQQFRNTSTQKIEAIYVFPLPHKAAVDDMVMTVGDRRVIGQIKPREEAREAFASAQAAGQIASLLEQERPNIFTQSLTNLEPGAQVDIQIRYSETLAYDDGVYTFVFPMVVGPRYMPGQPQGKSSGGWADDTTQVPDASKISPPVARPDKRAGHDISVTVRIDAGLPMRDVRSELHDVTVESTGAGRATVTLANKREIPNRDFVLHYRTAVDTISDGLFTHTDERGTFFTLLLQPPQKVTTGQAIPKEILFVVDRSGSMSGAPLGKVKEALRLAITQLNPNDTFNVLSFSDKADRLFAKAVGNTAAHRATALRYIGALDASGGTEMLPALLAAFNSPKDRERVRIVCFMTDGYVGNDLEIIAAVRKHAIDTRVFSFGVGNAVNRLLLDGVAYAGRGEVQYVTLNSEAQETISHFVERVNAPVLTGIALDWGTLPVSDVYPQQLPDLFSNTPIVVHGRLHSPATGTVTLRGRTAAGAFARTISFPTLPLDNSHAVLPSLWARAKVEDLMATDYAALQKGRFPEAQQKEILTLATQFRLLTQFTSFVAVEELSVTIGGEAKQIHIPVETPSGVAYEGIFGQASSRGVPGALGSPVTMIASLHGGGGSSSPAPELAAALAERRRQYQLSANPERSAAQAQANLMRDPQLGVSTKLAEPLQQLAVGAEGESKIDPALLKELHVVNHRVAVMLSLRDTSAVTLAALKEVEFIVTAESKTTRLLIGMIDVSKLEALAKLAAVLRIVPVSSNG